MRWLSTSLTITFRLIIVLHGIDAERVIMTVDFYLLSGPCIANYRITSNIPDQE